MTSLAAEVRLDVFTQDVDGALLASILPVYVATFREPPYGFGVRDVVEFVDWWPTRLAQAGFRCVIASTSASGQPVGFTFGHILRTNTQWWDGALGHLDVDTAEWPGRTFAVIELAVLRDWRGQGVASALHERVLDGVGVERVTLLVRPEAERARALYDKLGYRQVGQIRPWAGAPVYDAMVLDLHAGGVVSA